MPTNDGHRQRVKDRFRNEGLDHFEESHVLELLLFYCIPRVDTKPTAKRLLGHFGSLNRVLEASVGELQKVQGVGENAATFLTLISAVSRYYSVKSSDLPKTLDTTDKYGRFLTPYFRHRPNETVFLLCLDGKCKVICCREIGEGSVNSASVPIQKVAKVALEVNATTVILAHNHPSGLALPSDDDVATTLRVAKALDAVEVTLADHIIVAGDDFVSLVQSGVYHPVDARHPL